MLSFQEIGGSPKEVYSYDGFQATRTFLVPWEQRSEFALSVFGRESDETSSKRLTYPGRKDVVATQLTLEPFDSSAINVRELFDPKTDLVDYDGSYAKIIVQYQMLDSNDRNDAPINEEGTSISYKMIIDSEQVTLQTPGWRWNDTGSPLSEEVLVSKLVPTTIHLITWSNVVNPPWDRITAKQGTVNNALFLGCRPETLLFCGAEANKLYRPGYGLDEGPSSFVWAIKYQFSEKAVKMNNNTYGWNHVYHPETGQWTKINHGTATLYDASDFNSLFHAVMPNDIP